MSASELIEHYKSDFFSKTGNTLHISLLQPHNNHDIESLTEAINSLIPPKFSHIGDISKIRSRQIEIVILKQVFSYMASMMGYKRNYVGSRLGYKDHSTVVRNIAVVEDALSGRYRPDIVDVFRKVNKKMNQYEGVV